MTQTTDLSNTGETRNTQFIPQTRKMRILEMRDRIPRSHHRKRSPQNEPEET